MDLKEFYEAMGVDYARVLNRLRKEERIEKYLHLILKDESFQALEEAMQKRDYESAFRAAHAIKGMSLNLELTPLAQKVQAFVECVRDVSHVKAEAAETLYKDIKEEHKKLYHAIEG